MGLTRSSATNWWKAYWRSLPITGGPCLSVRTTSLRSRTLVTHVAYIDRGRLQFSEELTTLQDRFREVEVTCDQPVQVPSSWPGAWLKPETSSAVVRFVVTNYADDETPQAGQGDVSQLPRPVNTAHVLAGHLRQPGESASSSRKHGGTMNQIVHIFRKDCRRLWQIIAAVLVFTFLHGYGDAINPGGMVAVGLSPYALLYILMGLSWLILPIALFLLVVSVIQEESLVGSDKFWLTRPYNRRSLALEKLLFVALWAVPPMLLHDVVLIRHFGFSLSSAFGLLLWKNAQFGFFLLVGGYARRLECQLRPRRFTRHCRILGYCSYIFRRPAECRRPIALARGCATYEILIVLAVAAVGVLCVIAFQYRFRITSVAAAIGVVAILVCALLSRFWPSSLSAYLLQKNESPLLRSIQILPDADLKDIARILAKFRTPQPNRSLPTTLFRLQDCLTMSELTWLGCPPTLILPAKSQFPFI